MMFSISFCFLDQLWSFSNAKTFYNSFNNAPDSILTVVRQSHLEWKALEDGFIRHNGSSSRRTHCQTTSK